MNSRRKKLLQHRSWRWRRNLKLRVILTLFLVCCAPELLLKAQSETRATAKDILAQRAWSSQPVHIDLWDVIHQPKHPGFGEFCAELGDLNGDGYDDFAIAAATDTTFIFLGGDTVNHEPAWLVLGGGSGLQTGDFNGDGLLDLVTSIAGRLHKRGEPDPEERGKLRIYLGHGSWPPFSAEPELILRGKPTETLGIGRTPVYNNPLFQSLDYNGDGYTDVAAVALDKREGVNAMVVLFLGGPEMDTIPDRVFQTEPVGPSNYFVDDMLTGDLNGDGFDDLMISGNWMDTGLQKTVYYWELYLGNTDAITANPARIFRSDIGWSPYYPGSGIMDVNDDGFDDIIDGLELRYRGDIPIFFGSRDLPQIPLPNDSIPNFDPGPWGDESHGPVCPVGDMNGDGIDDLIVVWGTLTVPIQLYYLYPGGNKYKAPTGITGIHHFLEYIHPGMYPIGDVNGDGFDDVVALSKPGPYAATKYCLIYLYLGSGDLATHTDLLMSPSSFVISAYPQPAPRGTDALSFNVQGVQPGDFNVQLSDLLGRTIFRQSCEMVHPQMTISLPIRDLPGGIYVLTIKQGTLIQSLPVLIN